MKVLLDANVLYPTVMRECLLGCASRGLFEPRWSQRIEEEWARAAARLGPEAEAVARAEIAALARDFPEARVGGWERRLPGLWLPDPDDLHVLAAAIEGECDAILTDNAKDFPRDALRGRRIARLAPDAYLRALWERDPAAVEATVAEVVAKARSLSQVDWTARRLLRKARLHRLARAVA